MENGQMPPVQPMGGAMPSNGQVLSGPVPGSGAPYGGQMPGAGGRPMMQQAQQNIAPKKKDVVGIIKTVAIVILLIAVVALVGVYFWKDSELTEVQANVDLTVADAVAKAEDAQRTQDEANYQQEIKNPYQTFAGPADYGQLSFQYPKTWSVYVEQDASEGGDFTAYFNPVQVNTVSDETINALRVLISTEPYDDVIADFQRDVETRDSNLTVTTREIGNEAAGTRVVANYYTGTIPGTELEGYFAVFKIRDKTVILQTDSDEVFGADYETLLDTVTFNA